MGCPMVAPPRRSKKFKVPLGDCCLGVQTEGMGIASCGRGQ